MVFLTPNGPNGPKRHLISGDLVGNKIFYLVGYKLHSCPNYNSSAQVLGNTFWCTPSLELENSKIDS